jgi:hypothetical protein
MIGNARLSGRTAQRCVPQSLWQWYDSALFLPLRCPSLARRNNVFTDRILLVEYRKKEYSQGLKRPERPIYGEASHDLAWHCMPLTLRYM